MLLMIYKSYLNFLASCRLFTIHFNKMYCITIAGQPYRLLNNLDLLYLSDFIKFYFLVFKL